MDVPDGADEASAQSLRVVRAHYEAFARGDIGAIVAGLDPEVTITVHDEHGKPASDPLRGLEAARSFFDDINAAVTDPTVEIDRLRADGNRVLAHLRLGGTVRETGATGDIPAVHLFSVHGGLITEIRTHRPDWRNYQPG